MQLIVCFITCKLQLKTLITQKKNNMSPPSYLLFVFLFQILITSSTHNACSGNLSFIRDVEAASNFELLHAHPPRYQLKSTGGRRKITSGDSRQHLIKSSPLKDMKSEDVGLSKIELKVKATGIDFVATVRVGTPPQEFQLIADTGSDMTWINCDDSSNGSVFRANLSSSFEMVPCSSNICRQNQRATSCDPRTPPLIPCLYNIQYEDNSTSNGILVNETVTAGLEDGREIKLNNVQIGCSASMPRGFGTSDGVLGLGFTNNSFAVTIAKAFGNNTFSYCWDDITNPSKTSSNNYLTFGTISTSPMMQYTKLLVHEQLVYYYVNVTGISVGGVMLPIPSQVWESLDNGIIVDSGTTSTWLLSPAYDPLMAALKPTFTKFERVEKARPLPEFCFNTTTGFDESLVPKLTFHFGDNGVQFAPPVRNYVVEVDLGVRCLGFSRVAGSQGKSIIGNIMQQNLHWEFDLGRMKLGFAPSNSCA